MFPPLFLSSVIDLSQSDEQTSGDQNNPKWQKPFLFDVYFKFCVPSANMKGEGLAAVLQPANKSVRFDTLFQIASKQHCF